ncbi:hypothetical protein PQX77_010411 [Marasmius sp. AFHP31]|nr:hypothetical protein PQX77_010411 [Marasmius sp. AFHP31]
MDMTQTRQLEDVETRLDSSSLIIADDRKKTQARYPSAHLPKPKILSDARDLDRPPQRGDEDGQALAPAGNGTTFPTPPVPTDRDHDRQALDFQVQTCGAAYCIARLEAE